MIVFPNAKINLGLNIVCKRSDGYHNLETVFFPLNKCRDVLEVIQFNTAESSSTDDVSFSSSGLNIPGTAEENLCVKAYHLLKQRFSTLPPIQMHLHKAIPMGAGLGGGSADGAFALRLLNQKFNLALTDEELMSLALELGSDCPFFILNEPCFATGRGEQLRKISLNLSAFTIILVSPGIHINTGWAFSQIVPGRPTRSVSEIIQQPLETWKEELQNDFEKPVFEKHPEIGLIKNRLYEFGAVYSSLTGSGSTVYGIFNQRPERLPEFPSHYGLTIL